MSREVNLSTITILVTGAGAPGIQGTIYSLKKNYDSRKLYIIGTDVKDFVVGKYLCDEFYTISPAKDTQNYISDLITICEENNVNIILPQNTAELFLLSEYKHKFNKMNVKIILSDYKSIELANDKYKLFQTAEQLGIPVANYTLVSSFDELKLAAIKLGWPNKLFVVKPPISNGSRGVRIISECLDRKKAFYEEKPSSLYTTMDELYHTIGDCFPELIVMEYLPGDEYTVDVFRYDRTVIAIPRKRLSIRSGITFAASLEQNQFLMDCSVKLANSLGLTFCFGFQFKLHENGIPLLLESNPRVQGTMVMSTFAGGNIIYNSVKAVLGETIPDMSINWNTKLLRYWGGIGVMDDEYVKI